MAFSGNSQAGINVTPLIDVLLVPLIIFLVLAPVHPHGLNTQQPQGKPATTTEPLSPVVVELRATLKPLMDARAERTLFVHADRSLTFLPIAEVVATAKQVGAVIVLLNSPATK